MSDQVDDPAKKWTIKGIDPDVRNAIISAAKRDDLPIGEWIARAARDAIQADRRRSRAPTVILPAGGPEVGPEAPAAGGVDEIERLIAATSQLATAAGEPPPTAVTRAAYGLLRARLAELRGPTRRRSGRTRSADSRTQEGGGGEGEP